MNKGKYLIFYLLLTSVTNLNSMLVKWIESKWGKNNASTETYSSSNNATIINSTTQNGNVSFNFIPGAIPYLNCTTLPGDSQSIWNCVKRNKYKLAIVNILAVYFCSNTRLYFLEHKLKNSNCWSLWHKHKNLNGEEELQLNITNELIFEIQKRYTNADQPMDFIRPLIQFAKELDTEKKYLASYKRGCKIIKTLRLSGFFKINDKLFSETEDRLATLNCLNNLFTNWLATCKLENQNIRKN